jgi:hypothetical protein
MPLRYLILILLAPALLAVDLTPETHPALRQSGLETIRLLPLDPRISEVDGEQHVTHNMVIVATRSSTIHTEKDLALTLAVTSDPEFSQTVTITTKNPQGMSFVLRTGDKDYRSFTVKDYHLTITPIEPDLDQSAENK